MISLNWFITEFDYIVSKISIDSNLATINTNCYYPVIYFNCFPSEKAFPTFSPTLK